MCTHILSWVKTTIIKEKDNVVQKFMESFLGPKLLVVLGNGHWELN